MDGTFLFASQQRALFCFPGLAPRLSQDGLRQLLSLAPVPPPGIEMFEGIHLLPPASLLIFSPDGVSVHPYWALESRPHPDDYPTTAARVRQLADEAVRRELAGPPALGSFLSGSLSSSFVTAAAALAYTEDGRPAIGHLVPSAERGILHPTGGRCLSYPAPRSGVSPALLGQLYGGGRGDSGVSRHGPVGRRTVLSLPPGLRDLPHGPHRDWGRLYSGRLPLAGRGKAGLFSPSPGPPPCP